MGVLPHHLVICQAFFRFGCGLKHMTQISDSDQVTVNQEVAVLRFCSIITKPGVPLSQHLDKVSKKIQTPEWGFWNSTPRNTISRLYNIGLPFNFNTAAAKPEVPISQQLELYTLSVSTKFPFSHVHFSDILLVAKI